MVLPLWERPTERTALPLPGWKKNFCLTQLLAGFTCFVCFIQWLRNLNCGRNRGCCWGSEPCTKLHLFSSSLSWYPSWLSKISVSNLHMNLVMFSGKEDFTFCKITGHTPKAAGKVMHRRTIYIGMLKLSSYATTQNLLMRLNEALLITFHLMETLMALMAISSRSIWIHPEGHLPRIR